MPKGKSQAFGLIQGEWHSLSEITKNTNISKAILENLKKYDIPLNKVRTGRPLKLSGCHKCQIVFYIIHNHESCRLSVLSIIRDLQLDVHPTNPQKTLAIIIGEPSVNPFSRSLSATICKETCSFNCNIVNSWMANMAEWWMKFHLIINSTTSLA